MLNYVSLLKMKGKQINNNNNNNAVGIKNCN